MEAEVTLTRIRQETATVKSFLLDLGGVPFSFLPGQWVDFYIDTGLGIEVGGFSITSSPLQTETIELAVKKLPYSKSAVYLHERAKVGDSFFIDGGQGDFYYRGDMGGPLVLIAGGIGITPLMSMIRYADEANLNVGVTLIYSAMTSSELAFYDELKALSARNQQIKCVFTVTRPPEGHWDARVGRIDQALLEEHIPAKDALFYICGPTPMIDDITDLLTRLGVEPSHIRFERW